MSQHKMKTITADGTPCEVLIGWDRPMAGYFLVVERSDCPPDASDDIAYLFDNLRQPFPNAHPRSLGPFLEVLGSLGIQLPEPLQHRLTMDRESQVMNQLTYWSPAGEVLPHTPA